MYQSLVVSVVLISLFSSIPSPICVDVPDYDSGIASAGVKDIISGRYGDVIFATDSGISVYTANETWYSVNARYPGETAYGTISPINIMVNAIALDSEGRLWIGYPSGLQFQTTDGYEAVQDQQLLKNLNVNRIVRWGDEIWVATGRAGLHRYHNGNWTWYKPLGPEGLVCHTVESMVVDAASDALVIGSEHDGVRVLRSRVGEIQFEPVMIAKDWGFDLPSCIATDVSGSVYVVDSGNRHIQKFDGSGNLLTTLTSKCSEFSGLSGIVTDDCGNIYGVDRDSHCIQKFCSSGDLLATWGSYGSRECEFRSPAGIAIDTANNIYVADTGNSRIQKFDSSGNLLEVWGSCGTGDGEFQSPVGIAVDASGAIYVTDSKSKRIQKFDSSGRYLMKLGTPGGDDGVFLQPTGIATDSSGNVYVFDCDRIKKFDRFGKFLKKWGSRGTEDGEFLSSDCGMSVAIDGSDNIYVIDQGNHRIQKFDVSGKFLAKWEPEEPGRCEFLRPAGIAVGATGDIYVVDSGNNRIQKFGSSGEFLTAFGSSGFGRGEFWRASYTATDSEGSVYVADSNNHRVQKFSSSGKFLREIGSQGSGEGKFLWPAGIAVDGADDIYIADSGNHRIQKFNSSCEFVVSWGTCGTGDGEFRSPEGIAVDSSGDVYVVDAGNHRIQKFNSSGELLKVWGSRGLGTNEFQSPTDIAIDASGNVYVTDTDADQIKIFDASGNLLKVWQFRDVGGEALRSPSGIAFDASDNVYVASRDGHYIKKFARSPGSQGDSRVPAYTLTTKWGTKAYQYEPVLGISEVRVDPFGGVYLFNQTVILHYALDTGVTPVLCADDLEVFPVTINDVAATRGGTLLIASDNGIYGWDGSDASLHITSKDGIRSNVVKDLYIDAYDRCWFVVPGNVGYIPLMDGSDPLDLKPEPIQSGPGATPSIPDDIPTPEETAGERPGVIDMVKEAWASFTGWIGTIKGGLNGTPEV